MKSTKLQNFYVYMQYHTELESLVNLLVKLIDSASKVVKLIVSDNGIVQHFKLQQARDLQCFMSK